MNKKPKLYSHFETPFGSRPLIILTINPKMSDTSRYLFCQIFRKYANDSRHFKLSEIFNFWLAFQRQIIK